ncbi:MAG TPA: hypothetical protein VHP32_00575 [Ignavibacteria bacterium]|nr:hypothetical protein [Ignavibacteria bacterium]
MKTTFALIAFLFISNISYSQSSAKYQIIGTEPFWSLMITSNNAEFDLMDSPKIKFDSIKKKNMEGTSEGYGFAFEVSNKDASAMILLRKCEGCSDGMSEVKYTYEAFFVFNGKVYHGAANEVEK